MKRQIRDTHREKKKLARIEFLSKSETEERKKTRDKGALTFLIEPPLFFFLSRPWKYLPKRGRRGKRNGGSIIKPNLSIRFSFVPGWLWDPPPFDGPDRNNEINGSPYCWDKANRAVTRELMAIKHDYRLIRGWNKTGLTALRCQGDN